ncbi:MAG: tetratricopeptide repeat protein [Chromatiaceae bacterium]|jgi:tetratricopeptide (TPR) repeat protein|nr:tetratricopeptide repeat protein [Chromatiaceae bacterium]
MRLPTLTLAAVISAAFSFHTLAGDAAALIDKGEAQLEAGEIGAAVETLQQAVEADPKSSLAYTRLGGAQVMAQEYGAGLESFKQAIALDAGNANAFVGMAVAYLHSSRYPLAKAALEEAKRIDPAKREEADKLIAWIEQRLPNGSQ